MRAPREVRHRRTALALHATPKQLGAIVSSALLAAFAPESSLGMEVARRAAAVQDSLALQAALELGDVPHKHRAAAHIVSARGGGLPGRVGTAARATVGKVNAARHDAFLPQTRGSDLVQEQEPGPVSAVPVPSAEVPVEVPSGTFHCSAVSTRGSTARSAQGP